MNTTCYFKQNVREHGKHDETEEEPQLFQGLNCNCHFIEGNPFVFGFCWKLMHYFIWILKNMDYLELGDLFG